MRAERSVLLVCTGNICRSPTAEAVMRAGAERRGLGKRLRIASAGTHDYHVGESPDPRAVKHASRRGYDLSRLRASQVTARDFHEFDYILAMDRGHLQLLRSIAPSDARARLGLFLEGGTAGEGDVPDPYYGGPEGFERVLDMVEEAADRWIERIARELEAGTVGRKT